LALSPGEAAINPVPREMMTNAVSEIAAHHGAQADFEITVSVPGGEKLAEKTLNGRLGIIGGLSILGTTGIVVPYSCSAWVHAIHRGIDVARAGGETHLVAATGRTSELAAQKHCGASETALIEMGDFAGGVLKYLRDHPVPRLTLAGGFAKISKLAAGHMDLHSARSQVDMAALKSDLEALGAGADLLAEAEKSIAAGAVFELAQAAGLPLADRIAAQARDAACEVLVPSDGQRDKDKIAVDVLVFDRCGRLIGAAVAP
jgi:cobalt-precorrin-5B (C1)-methyltransferase